MERFRCDFGENLISAIQVQLFIEAATTFEKLLLRDAHVQFETMHRRSSVSYGNIENGI